MKTKLELGHDAEVAATAAQAPEQVRVLGRRRADQLPVRGHERVRLDVVARQPELTREPAHPAAERQSSDSRVTDIARRRRETERLCRPVEVPQLRAALDEGSASIRVDADTIHRPEIDQQAAVRHCEPANAVTAAVHADLEARGAPEGDSRSDVLGRGAAGDDGRPPVDERVPDLTPKVVLVVARIDDLAREARDASACGHGR